MVGEWRLSVPRGAGAVVPAVCGIVEACEAEAEVERVGRGFTEMKCKINFFKNVFTNHQTVI